VPALDENGVAAPGSGKERVRARLSQLAYGDNLPPPTREQLEEAYRHDHHVRELEADADQRPGAHGPG